MSSNKDFRERMDRLEELAGKARQREYESWTENINCYGRRIGVVLSERGEYIAAANPAIMLEMIAELRSLEKKLNDKKAHVGRQAARIKMLEDNLSGLQEAYRKLDKEADWLASRVKCDNRFTPAQEAACIIENGPCVKCLREAAERAVQAKPEP